MGFQLKDNIQNVHEQQDLFTLMSTSSLISGGDLNTYHASTTTNFESKFVGDVIV